MYVSKHDLAASSLALPPSGVLDAFGVEATVARPAVWWVGVHGGAGESTLERLFAGSRAAGHRWPTGPASEAPAVVLVARTHEQGLRALQTALRDHSERQLSVHVLGVVLVADAPGRLPRVLGDLRRVVSGGAPAVWSLPFVEAWRLGETPSRRNSPKEVARLFEELLAALIESREDA